MQIVSSSAVPTPAILAPTRSASAAEATATSPAFAEVLAAVRQEAADSPIAAVPQATVHALKAPALPPLFKYADDGVITGDEMRLELAEAKSEYLSRLKTAMAAHGLEASQPFRLTSDAQGQVRVVGEHPGKAQIEALFAEDPQLTQAFHRTSAIAHLIANAEEAIAFQQAYAQDPRAAVARYASLFNTTLSTTMMLRWGPDGLELDFQSERKMA